MYRIFAGPALLLKNTIYWLIQDSDELFRQIGGATQIGCPAFSFSGIRTSGISHKGQFYLFYEPRSSSPSSLQKKMIPKADAKSIELADKAERLDGLLDEAKRRKKELNDTQNELIRLKKLLKQAENTETVSKETKLFNGSDYL